MTSPTRWDAMADRVLAGDHLPDADALAVLESPDDELLAVLDAAFRVRRHHHGRTVKVHVLRNAKSGLCPEDCAFCSQSSRFRESGAAVPEYDLQTVEQLVDGARQAIDMGATTYCMVTATRGPSGGDIETISAAARRIKADAPHVKLCASLGLLEDGQAERLRDAGVDRYNHNLETSERFYAQICSTHTWQDRLETVRKAKAAGLEACCGGIVGMGEQRADRVALALSLRELGVESVPVNFLDPRPNTPLGEQTRTSPQEALRTLAMFRLVCPDRDVRAAGGREVTLRALQPLALYAANSMFTRGYLTTGGAEASADLQMIRDAGFEPLVLGAEGPEPLPAATPPVAAS